MKGAVAAVGKRAAIAGGAVTGLLFTAFVLAGGAQAATDDGGVSDAFTEMKTNVTTYGTAVVGIVIASVLIFLGIKYLRKGSSKA